MNIRRILPFGRTIQVGTPTMLLSLVFLTSCGTIGDFTDKILFGTASETRVVPRADCTSSINISYRQISLSEDGDVVAAFDGTKDKFISETDTNGGTAWGYRSFETCIYPTATFTGTIKFNVKSSGTYAGRINATWSNPARGVNGQPLPNELTFTGSGLAHRQCFRFERVDDSIRNSREAPLVISLGTITELDGSGNLNPTGAYHGADVCDISVTMDDDESPGIRVSNISRVMEEPGGVSTVNNATFTVVLRQPPGADVLVSINDTYDPVNAGNREGTTSPTTLTFTTGNWNTPQTVTVTSVDDHEIDGLKTYTIQLPPVRSSDPDYNGLDPRDVVVYNRDQTVPGYSIQKWDTTTQVTGGSGATITGFAADEANQMGSTYSTMGIKLRSKPSANVTLTFSTTCGSKCRLITNSLTFTPSNWNTYQTIQVEGASDSANNGNADYEVTFTAASADSIYNSTVTEPVIKVRSCDNDASHLIHTCNFSGQPLGTTGNRFSRPEASTSPSTVWLIAQSAPASDIRVPLSSDDSSEGTIGNTGSESVINSSNYNKMEASGSNRIIMNHVDDASVDGSQDWTVITGTSTGVVTYNPVDVYATTTDNEKYFYISIIGGVTKEDGTYTTTVHVCLGADNPDQPITLNLTCTRQGEECGTINPSSITFPVHSQVSLENASDSGCADDAKKQTFTVTGADDPYADGPQTFVVNLHKVPTTDGGYHNAPDPQPVGIMNFDDEPPGKAIFFTDAGHVGEMTAEGVLGADKTCNDTRPSYAPSGTYKALIVSNSAGEVNDRTPALNWVINPSYYYYKCISSGPAGCSDRYQHLFTGGAFNPLSMTDHNGNPIYFPNGEYWTGMTVGLSPATQPSTPDNTVCSDSLVYRHNCHGFTYGTCPSNGAVKFYGQTWLSSGGSLTDQERMCTDSYKLICVEQ